jgi:two-component system, OmpR family, sensor histidine kinase CiaH
MNRLSHRHSPFAATRRRLLLMNLLVVSTMIAVMAVAVYAWEARITDQQITQDVMARAGHDTARNVLLVTPGSGSGARESSDAAELYEPSSPNVFTVVLNAQGKVIYDPGNVRALGLPDMSSARSVLSGAADHALVTVGDDTRAFRLYTVAIREDGNVVGAVQTGMSLESRSRQLHGLLVTLLIVGIGMLALTALVSLFLADRALAPTHEAYERERRFVAAASHELRTPLAILRSQAELVARHLRRPSQADDAAATNTHSELAADVDEITDEVDYMARLVRDLLTLARPDDEREPSEMSPADLWAVAENGVTSVRPQAEERNLSLTLAGQNDPEHPPVLVSGDADRLRQLLLILLENALAYTPPGGAITVEVEKHMARRPKAVLRVEDSGKGIAADDLPHIFEPFYRADRARGHGDHTSSGLGLALARKIVHGYGGEITASSRLGSGSTFTVTLPLATDDEATAAR